MGWYLVHYPLHYKERERPFSAHKNMNNGNLIKNSLSNLITQLKARNGHKENTKPGRRLDEKAVQDM